MEKIVALCPNCKIEKFLEEFAKNSAKKNGHSSWCKKCCQENDKKRYIRDRVKILKRRTEYREEKKYWLENYKKNLKCQKCGETRWYILTFHHKNPDKKDFNISSSYRITNIKKIKKEIEKCEILCQNCHVELHHFERNNLEIVG